MGEKINIIKIYWQTSANLKEGSNVLIYVPQEVEFPIPEITAD